MVLTESLTDLILDLHDLYGIASTKPAGKAVKFSVIHNDTTYEEASKQINELLTRHRLTPVSLVITPGPEVEQQNRRIDFSVLIRDLT